MTGRLAVLASGTGTNLGAILEATADGRLAAEVVAVFTNRRNARARLIAEQAGVPTHFRPLVSHLDRDRSPEPRSGPAEAARADTISTPDVGGWAASPTRRRYDADLAEAVAAVKPDLVVLAGWMHLLSQVFLDRFPNRVVNLHPALPGQFPGDSAIADAWNAFKAGRIDRTGVMVHYVPDEGVDSGPVIASVEVPIGAGDTFETLGQRIHEAEHRLIVAAVAEALDRAR